MDAELQPPSKRSRPDTSTTTTEQTTGPEPRGHKRDAEPQGSGRSSKAARPANSLVCATCGTAFTTKNRLHHHLRKARHHVRDDPPVGPVDHQDEDAPRHEIVTNGVSESPELCDSSDDETERSSMEQRRMQAQRYRRAVLDHFASENRGSSPHGSSEMASGTEDGVAGGGGGAPQEHAMGTSPEPKPNLQVDTLGKGHPGPRPPPTGAWPGPGPSARAY